MILLPSSIAFLFCIWGATYRNMHPAGRIALAIIASVPLGVIVQTVWWLRLPRLARVGDQFLIYLRDFRPLRVPVEVVECFFRGQAPVGISVPARSGGEELALESVNVVMRLAERSFFYHEREVAPSLGKWCGGYVTLRGTGCEPITPQLLEQLNRRLALLHRERASKSAEASSSTKKPAAE